MHGTAKCYVRAELRTSPLAALSLLACFLLALASQALVAAAHFDGKLAIAVDVKGMAASPRQACPARLSAKATSRHRQALPAQGSAGLASSDALALIRARAAVKSPSFATPQLLSRYCQLPRGPPPALLS